MSDDELAYRLACQWRGRNPASPESRSWWSGNMAYSDRDQFGRLVTLIRELETRMNDQQFNSGKCPHCGACLHCGSRSAPLAYGQQFQGPLYNGIGLGSIPYPLSNTFGLNQQAAQLGHSCDHSAGHPPDAP